MRVRNLSTEYGEQITITEWTIDERGEITRKMKIYKSTTVDPETGAIIREFDSPVYLKHDFGNALEAGKKARQLIDSGVIITVDYYMDGRSGSNAESSLSADLMTMFLRGFAS